MWPDDRIQNLFGIELPIVQAPMAGVAFSEMAIGVSEAGGLGSLGCALLTPDQITQEVKIIRQQTSRPINLNFFCHQPPKADAEREAAWRRVLEPYVMELGLDPTTVPSGSGRGAFDSAMCDLVAELKPNVVSFHFGLPEKKLVGRIRATGAKVLSSATTAEEARWLEAEGCDAIVAQGFEAGGHRGMFLANDISTQIGTLSLVPQAVDSVKVPVIAAGGIADARGIAAALALGAAAVQLGTAYLLSPEARTSSLYRQGLRKHRVAGLSSRIRTKGIKQRSRMYSQGGLHGRWLRAWFGKQAQCRDWYRIFRAQPAFLLRSVLRPRQRGRPTSRLYGLANRFV